MITVESILREDMPTTAWSGGKTTQIAIFPRGRIYAERNFLWRISTATITTEQSDFTQLPDYMRIIASVRGDMHITHNGGETNYIAPMRTVHVFDGADATRCIGGEIDLNLMLRKGACLGELELFAERTTRRIELKKGDHVLLYRIGGYAQLFTGQGEKALSIEADSALFTIHVK